MAKKQNMTKKQNNTKHTVTRVHEIDDYSGKYINFINKVNHFLSNHKIIGNVQFQVGLISNGYARLALITYVSSKNESK